jgi:hypothetical protein
MIVMSPIAAVMNEQLLEALLQLAGAIAKDGWWVPLEEYLARNRGETAEAVKSRRSKKDPKTGRPVWTDGVESKFVRGSGIWVNLLAVNSWAARSELRLVSPSDTTPRASRKASASPSASGASSARSPS